LPLVPYPAATEGMWVMAVDSGGLAGPTAAFTTLHLSPYLFPRRQPALRPVRPGGCHPALASVVLAAFARRGLPE
jgi:hypothetical protein